MQLCKKREWHCTINRLYSDNNTSCIIMIVFRLAYTCYDFALQSTGKLFMVMNTQRDIVTRHDAHTRLLLSFSELVMGKVSVNGTHLTLVQLCDEVQN